MEKTKQANSACVNCYQFAGSSKQNNLCSVCYRESLQIKEAERKKSIESQNETTMEIEVSKVESKNPDETPKNKGRKKQKNKKRCFNCRRKVGYNGFKCKCDYVFCGKHR